MPTHGTTQHAHEAACNYVGEVSNGECKADRHGTSTAYRHGCRCPEARAVMARLQLERTKRRYLNRGPLQTDATGTHRRLQALQANGWPRRTLAAYLGYHSGCLPPLLYDLVHIDTAARIKALYDKLADTRGPSSSAQIRARAKGWLPPIAWDDDTIDNPAATVNTPTAPDVDPIAVERRIRGDVTVPLNRAEKNVAVRQMHAAGRTPAVIAMQLHMSGASVYKRLAAMALDVAS